MQIVIDIPEEMYKYILSMQLYIPGLRSGKSLLEKIFKAIRIGTPLLKHGRLIDADELEECIELMNTINGETKYAVRWDDIRNMATIIEADKEVNNGDSN